jgi:hypothetical protein
VGQTPAYGRYVPYHPRKEPRSGAPITSAEAVAIAEIRIGNRLVYGERMGRYFLSAGPKSRGPSLDLRDEIRYCRVRRFRR